MSRGHRRALLGGLLVVIVIGLILLLLPRRPRNEPTYQGRYLSEWMRVLVTHPSPDGYIATQEAVRKMGTNAVPHFVSWLSYERPLWKTRLDRQLPRWFKQIDGVAKLLGREEDMRAAFGVQGIGILGTNAACAIPKLDFLIQRQTNAVVAWRAMDAIVRIGPEAVPVLHAAFSNTNQPFRRETLWTIRGLALISHGKTYSNDCISIISAALEDQDLQIRSKAAALLQVTSTADLVKIPRR